MTEKIEALLLADALIERHGVESFEGDAAAELRRLSAENDLLGSAADKLRVAWRDEVHRLYAQRDALTEALKDVLRYVPSVADGAIKARAAIAKAEGEAS